MIKEKANEKCNDACIKIFEFIKMLYAGDVEFKAVIEHFSDGNYDGTSNTHVTINKYLNAMKIFGINIVKEKNKYKILNSVYKIKLDKYDLRSVLLLKELEKVLPNNKTKKNFSEFIRAIEMRIDEQVQNHLQISDDEHFPIFYNAEMVEQLKRCERYCLEKHKLEIIYKDEKNTKINLLCSPIEPIYNKRKICLKVLGANGSRVYEIPVENIISIKQLPTQSSSLSIPLTVVYKIKNRLALNYKLREWERLETIEDDGSHIIINKNEDLNILIKRLMRYGRECEVISPKFFKEEMLDVINKTLANYNII